MLITLSLPDDADAPMYKWAAKCAYSTASEEYNGPRSWARGKQRCKVTKQGKGKGYKAEVTIDE